MLENIFKKVFGTANERVLERMAPIVDRINSLEATVANLPDDRLAASTAEFRQRLANG